jgi:hypothetical protein
MKYQLKPVDTNFKISTTNIHFSVNERSSLPLIFDVVFTDDKERGTITTIELTFPLFAIIDYKMLNFWEANYNDFEIMDERSTDFGFYYVANSKWDKSIYDPLKRLELEHFLITGYDSYIEVLANKNFGVNILNSDVNDG